MTPAEFVLPRYQEAALSDLLPSVLARLTGGTPVVELPKASRYVVLLIDGLGWEVLYQHRDHADFLASMLPTAKQLTCSVPSTTATSLSSLGCGTPPGRHGIVGYTFLDPATQQVLNALSWEGGPTDIASFKLVPTQYHRLAELGQQAACVSLARFETSALQQIAFEATKHIGIEIEEDASEFISAILGALQNHELVYGYQRLLDHTGHSRGVGGWEWLDCLGHMDDLVAQLAAALPPDVCLLVTGDHGMVNVPLEHRLVIEDHAAFDGVQHIAGEGRFRQFYSPEPERLAESIGVFLGERGTVIQRQDAIAAGWFGPEVAPGAAERIGDVLVAMRDDWALMSQAFPGEFGLVGMHGSLTSAEMLVPLLARGGD